MNVNKAIAVGGLTVEVSSRTRGLLAPLIEALRRSAVRRQLMELDERLLRDVGLTRSDVAAGRF